LTCSKELPGNPFSMLCPGVSSDGESHEFRRLFDNESSSRRLEYIIPPHQRNSCWKDFGGDIRSKSVESAEEEPLLDETTGRSTDILPLPSFTAFQESPIDGSMDSPGPEMTGSRCVAAGKFRPGLWSKPVCSTNSCVEGEVSMCLSSVSPLIDGKARTVGRFGSAFLAEMCDPLMPLSP